MRYLLWLIARLAAVVFALTTWAYCVSTYSPFAFDRFVEVRLFKWIDPFVDWHHLWYAAAYVLSLITILPELSGRSGNKTARVLAVAYALAFLAVGFMLMQSPYLRLLSTVNRGPLTGFAGLIPVLWLAVIDLVSTRPQMIAATTGQAETAGRRIMVAAIASALVMWLIHFSRALINDPQLATDGLAIGAGAWSLALALAAYAILFLVAILVTSAASTQKRPALTEFGLTAILLAIGISEYCRRLVFPSMAFSDRDAALIAVAFGVTIAAAWAGLRARLVASNPRTTVDTALLLSPSMHASVLIVLLIVAMPVAALAIIDRVRAFDWDFLLQKTTTLLEGLIMFALWLRLIGNGNRRRVSIPWIVAAPAIAVVLVALVPRVVRADVILDRYAVDDPSFRLTADALVEHRARDQQFATAMLDAAKRSLAPQPIAPVDFVATPAPDGPRPNIFLFVVDGLRRDYLSPYNARVKFTPAIGEWARDAFVFQNAFTKYGGTWLAMPSIWSGVPVRRAWSRPGFEQINALEKLITSNHYRFAINDFTVHTHLRPTTTRTEINPGVQALDADFCDQADGVEKLIQPGAPPLASFVVPMNVYVLNSSHSELVNDPSSPYDGFRSGYAANVARVDSCFGKFVSFLKRSGQYDNSIIAITADHGESLGEDGNYGHQFWLFPEDIRIPLMISVPSRLRSALTTDTGRIAFSTDLVPTLWRLLGNDVRDLGYLAGSPLVTNAGSELPSRRRQPYVVMSSYGASYGMLRRNGKMLFIADLVNYREHAFELFQQPLGTRVRVTDDLRSVNQALIRRQIEDIEAFYGRH